MISQSKVGLLAVTSAIELGLAGVGAASAAVLLDQEQPTFALTGSLEIGGPSEQKLAQTVEAGRNGRMVRIDLPVGCSGDGQLVLTINELTVDGLPGGRTLGITRVPATDLVLTDPPTFRAIHLERPIALNAGDRFAIVLEAEGAICGLVESSAGDLYSRGEGFFDARPNPPGWSRFSPSSSPYDDLVFKTWIDVPRWGASSNFCTLATAPPHLAAPGGGPVRLPFPAWLPICRCLEDPGLRSERCGLWLPELFLYREVPWPIEPGQQFDVRWTAVPLVDGAKAPIVLETPPQWISGQGAKLDFGQDLEALRPVERRVPAVAGEKVGHEGWTIEYVWPD